MFSNMKVRTRLLAAFLAIGLLPCLFMVVIFLYRSGEALSDKAYAQLVSLREAKSAQIADFLKERKGDMGVLLEMVDIRRRETFARLDALKRNKKSRVIHYFVSLCPGSIR